MAIKQEPNKNKNQNLLYVAILFLILFVAIISVGILRFILDMKNKTKINNKVINESLDTQVLKQNTPVMQTIIKTEIKTIDKPVPVPVFVNTKLKDILKGRIEPKDLFRVGFTPKELHNHGYYVKLLFFESKYDRNSVTGIFFTTSSFKKDDYYKHIDDTIKKIEDNEKNIDSKVCIESITNRTNRKTFDHFLARASDKNPYATTIYAVISETPFKFDLKPFELDNEFSFKSMDFNQDLNSFIGTQVSLHDILELGFSRQDLINIMLKDEDFKNLTEKEREEALQEALDDEINENDNLLNN